MNAILFTVPGEPRGQGRPRFTRFGSGGRAYKDKKDATKESIIAFSYQQRAGAVPPHDGPVALFVTASFIPPKSWSKKKRQDPGFKTSKPDTDNIVKSVKDALNGLAWLDDSQVIELHASKMYGARNETVIEIRRL